MNLNELLSVNQCLQVNFYFVSVVLVTDATSFVSSHIIKHLQDEGYQVRGTVSSLTEEEERVKLVHEMSPDAKFKVEVVEADPASSDAWER